MAGLELTPDERYLRAYYLECEQSWTSSLMGELQYPLPGIVFAFFSWRTEDQSFLWVGFAWLLGSFIYRNASTRWAKATSGLIKKYEAKITELEAK